MLRGIWLLLVLLSGPSLSAAQESSRVLLGTQFQERIHAIADDAQAVIGLTIVDLATGDTFAINGDVTFPQASAIKIPILVELLNQARNGRSPLDERLSVSREATVGGAGILQHFGDGNSELSLRDLGVLMIVLSDNTATNLLIDRVGMESVNRMLDEAGFSEIRLRRRMMDAAASSRDEENIATPQAAARLMAALYEGTLTDADVRSEALQMLSLPKSTLMDTPQGVRVYNKKGSLEGVNAEWAVVDLPRRPYVFVFMSVFADGNAARHAAAEISRLTHRYFSILARTTEHGVLVDPSLLND